jgi:copper chaperone CopZ
MICHEKIKVEGMTCGGCASSVKSALQNVKGVTEANVDLKSGWAEIIYDDTYVDPRILATAIQGAGYRPVLEAAN